MSHVKLNVGRKKQNCVVVVIGFSLLASVLVLSSAAFCESSSQELQFPLRVSEQQITQRMDPRTIVNVGSVPPLKERFTTADRARMLAAVSASQQGPAKPLARTVGAVRYYAYNVEFDGKESCDRFNVAGATVFSRIDRFADMFLPGDATLQAVYDAVWSSPGVVWVENTGVANSPPPSRGMPAPPSKQPPETIVRGGLAPLTGKGIVIGLVDSGVDFRNADFITYNEKRVPTSRLLYLWDTTSDAYDSKRIGHKPPLVYPNGSSIGTLYDGSQLTDALRTDDRRIPETDVAGHGTACAGIAAGNGNGLPKTSFVRGVAPDAAIIAVRIGGLTMADGSVTPYLENSYLLNAICGWLNEIVGSTPLIVSCSFGGHAGGHDGQLIQERELDVRFPLSAKGRAIVIAAGNEGRDRLHMELNCGGRGAEGVIGFSVPAPRNSEKPPYAEMNIYTDSSNVNDLNIAGAEGMDFQVVEMKVNPFTRQAYASVEINSWGDGRLFVFTKSGERRVADVYLLGGSIESGRESYERLIGTPGTTANGITVGSYDWNDEFETGGRKISLNDVCGLRQPLVIGGLSCYSSIGYARYFNGAGVVKPDVVAPGEYFYASYAKMRTGEGVNATENFPDTSKRYCLFNGTSAATPYTAGVLALIMQKRPEITLQELKDLLQKNASHRAESTGAVPNKKWGYGKLDLEAIRNIMKAIS